MFQNDVIKEESYGNTIQKTQYDVEEKNIGIDMDE